MYFKKILPALAALALLATLPAHAVTPRDTIYVSSAYTTHVLLPTVAENAEITPDAPVSVLLSSARPEMVALRANEQFSGVHTLTVEDPSGAFRIYAVAFSLRPERLLVDLRPGSPIDRLTDELPVIEVTKQKKLHIKLPGRVTYSNLDAFVLSGETIGENKDDFTVSAQAPFKDSTNLTLIDATGTMHMYLVRYRKSIKKTTVTAKADPAGGQDAAPKKPNPAPAPAPMARETLQVSKTIATYAVFPTAAADIILPQLPSFTAEPVEGRPEMLALRAVQPFDDAVTMFVEDTTGAYRPVAVAYSERPVRVVTDLRPGAPGEMRLSASPVIAVSAKKALKIILPTSVAYADFGTPGKISCEVTGDRKTDVSMKAPAAFKDTVAVVIMDRSGSIYPYLVRYSRNIKLQEIDLRPAPEQEPAIKEQPKEGAPDGAKEEKEAKDQKGESGKQAVASGNDKTVISNDDGAFSPALVVAADPVPEKNPDTAPAAPTATKSLGDTVYVSDIYTTHMIFSTEINYADLSNQTLIAAKIIDGSKNKLALKARSPFTATASVSVEEADGAFHTYIVAYRKEPGILIVDKRPGAENFDMTDIETVEVSDKYTTHLIFATDIGYADLSRPSVLSGKLVDQGKNKLALMARSPFKGRANVSVEEANGIFHTYLLKYAETPSQLVLDTREEVVLQDASGTVPSPEINTGSKVKNSREKEATAHRRAKGVSANALRRGDAPLLSEVIEMNQMLYHTAARNYHLTFLCENIFSYSDITYFVLSLTNDSGISYETGDAVFVLESNNGSRRKIVYESNIFPKNRFGKLTTAAHSKGKVAYSFDKITLSKDQVIKVYLYESNGSRNLVLTLTAKDINGAVEPF